MCVCVQLGGQLRIGGEEERVLAGAPLRKEDSSWGSGMVVMYALQCEPCEAAAGAQVDS